MNNLKIAKVKLSNILGITELEFTPEGFNEISGPNGTGKTSVLEGIKAAIQSGHDATLLRKGETKGEAILVLDDGSEISKTITESKSTPKVKIEGKTAPRPGEFIKGLTDLFQANPVEFLRARKQDRVKVLLETMPLVADATRLMEITGIPVKDNDEIHALDLIETLRKQMYDDRTGTNRAIKEKNNTINQLRQAMPEPIAGVTGSEADMQASIEGYDLARDAELNRITEKLDGIRKANQSQIDEIRAKAQADIDAIKTAAQTAVDGLKAKLADIESKAGAQRELTLTRHTELVQPVKSSLAAIKADRDNAAKREQAIETIKQMEKQLLELQADEKWQTQALADLEGYKSELLNSLPIPGVEVKDGEVYRDGVVFDRLNTAQQVWIAVEIAKLRSGTLRICCVDGFELLDQKAFDAFKEQALASDMQLFVSRVTNEEFSVKTSNSTEE